MAPCRAGLTGSVPSNLSPAPSPRSPPALVSLWGRGCCSPHPPDAPPAAQHNNPQGTEAAAAGALREGAAAPRTTPPHQPGPATALPPRAAPRLSGRERRCKHGESVPPVRMVPSTAAGAARQLRARSQTAALEPCGQREPGASAKPRALPALQTLPDSPGPARAPHSAPTARSTPNVLSDAPLPRGCVPQFPLAEQRWLRSGPPPASPATATPQPCRRSGLTGKLSHTNPIRPPQLELCNGERVVMAMPPLATPLPSAPHCPRCCPTPQRARTPNTPMGRRANPSPSLTPLRAPRQDPLPAGVPNCTSSGP